jgi:hypothetical protein
MSFSDHMLGFRQPLFISDDGDIDGFSSSIDEWVKACIYLGWWAKSRYQKEKRRITLVVLPTRETTTAFAALGALIYCISSYKDGLTWDKFSRLESGAEVYWKRIETGDLYFGKVVGVELIGTEPAIKLEITKSRKAKVVGSFMLIPEAQFDKFQFTLEKPASGQREAVINASISFMDRLIGNVSSAWAKSDGEDLLLITKMNQFKSSIEELSMGVGTSGFMSSIDLVSLLGFEQLGDDRQSKMKITHPKGDLNSNAGLVILDGPSAFSIREHVPLTNDLLIIFDSLEFNENELDFVKTLQSVDEQSDLLTDSRIGTELFPVGFEISSYCFSR